MFTTGLVTLLWTLAACRVLQARPRLTPTSLLTAWRWSVAAVGVWTAAWLGERLPLGPLESHADRLWHLAAVSAICPGIAVLGARRPGVRVWSWFVLLPLVAVFGSPALTPAAWSGGGVTVPLPIAMGLAIVLLMGLGNYVGTRYALAAALAGVAVCLVVAPLSEAAPRLPLEPATLHLLAVVCLSLAVLWGDWQSRRPTVSDSPLNHLWLDFRDTFGIVWARRILDRVNDRAVAENWPWRLSDFGLVPRPPGAQRPASIDMTSPDAAKTEHAFRWLLRRFVDPPWIEARLHPASRAVAEAAPATAVEAHRETQPTSG